MSSKTPEPIRRRWGTEMVQLPPVDRSISNKPPLPRGNTKYGQSVLAAPTRGLGLLTLEIEQSGHVPSTEDLMKCLRNATAAAATPAPSAHEDTSAATRARSIRDAVDLIGRQCPSVRPLLACICDAYEAEIRKAAVAQNHPQLPSKDMLTTMLREVSMANERGDSPLSVAAATLSPPVSRVQSVNYGSGVFAASPTMVSEYGSLSTLSKRQLAGQLREAQELAVNLGHRIDELEHENASLVRAGDELRTAVDTASRKLQAAVAGFQRSHMLDGVTIDELDEANTPLHQVDGVTLLLLGKAWKRREVELIDRIESLTNTLAEKEVMLHRLSALASTTKLPPVFSPTRR